MSEDRDAERRRLLAAIVPHVAFDGWTHQALKAGFADEEREAWEVRRYFPGGPGDALALFSAEADRLMLEALGRLDLSAMRDAAQHLIGEHDFRSFARATPSDKDCVRRIHEISIVRNDPRVTFTLTGNGFLYTMIRSLVGTLMQVGLGKLKTTDVKRILEARDRRKAGPTAPAKGLFLIEVKY